MAAARIGRWTERNPKVHVKNSARQAKKESRFCIELLLVMKNGSVLRKKSNMDRGKKAKSVARPNRFGKKTMLYVFWNQHDITRYELQKSGDTVDGPCLQCQLADLNRAIRQKHPEYQLRHDKIIFLDDNAPPQRTKATLGLGIIVQLGIPTPPALLTRLGTNRLPLVCINGTSTYRAALHCSRKCEKMGRWLLCGKRRTARFFFGEVSINCKRGGKNVWLAMMITSKNRFVTIFFKINVNWERKTTHFIFFVLLVEQ